MTSPRPRGIVVFHGVLVQNSPGAHVHVQMGEPAGLAATAWRPELASARRSPLLPDPDPARRVPRAFIQTSIDPLSRFDELAGSFLSRRGAYDGIRWVQPDDGCTNLEYVGAVQLKEALDLANAELSFLNQSQVEKQRIEVLRRRADAIEGELRLRSPKVWCAYRKKAERLVEVQAAYARLAGQYIESRANIKGSEEQLLHRDYTQLRDMQCEIDILRGEFRSFEQRHRISFGLPLQEKAHFSRLTPPPPMRAERVPAPRPSGPTAEELAIAKAASSLKRIRAFAEECLRRNNLSQWDWRQSAPAMVVACRSAVPSSVLEDALAVLSQGGEGTAPEAALVKAELVMRSPQFWKDLEAKARMVFDFFVAGCPQHQLEQEDFFELCDAAQRLRDVQQNYGLDFGIPHAAVLDRLTGRFL